MKVALIVTGGLHPSGRVQTIPALRTFVERLALSHEVHALAVRHLREPSTYPLGGATVHDLGRPAGRLAQWRAVARCLAHIGTPDVIHGYWADPSGLLAAMAGRRRGIPSVVSCASGEFTALPAFEYGVQRSWRGRRVVSLALALASAVHVTSEYMQGLAAAHGLDAACVPFGVAVHPEARRRRMSAGREARLLQVASINRVKDHATLLRALHIVLRQRPCHLDLVGEDTLDGEVQRQAEALGVGAHVTFHGFVPHQELPRFHGDADLYVQSSRHEAAGVAVLEAAAAGVPIVGTRTGFVSDWDGRAAVAVAPGDAEALAAAILALLDDEPRRERLARAARAWAEAHDADYTAAAMTALYESLRATRRP